MLLRGLHQKLLHDAGSFARDFKMGVDALSGLTLPARL